MCGWDAISVDPIAIPIAGVDVRSEKIEDVTIQCKSKCVVAFVHAHVSIEESLKSLEFPDGIESLNIVSIPCCKYYKEHEDIKGVAPDVELIDYGILSPANMIRLWKNLKLQ